MKWMIVPAVALIFGTANVASADLLGRLGITFGNEVISGEPTLASTTAYGGPVEVYSDGVIQHSGKAVQHGHGGCCEQKSHHAFGLWNGYCGGHGKHGCGGKCGAPKVKTCKPNFGWHAFKSDCGCASKGGGCDGQLQKGHVVTQKGHGHTQKSFSHSTQKGHVSTQKGHGYAQKSFSHSTQKGHASTQKDHGHTQKSFSHSAQKGCGCAAPKHGGCDQGCGCNPCGLGGLFSFLHKGHGAKGSDDCGCGSIGHYGKGYDYGKGGVIYDHGQSHDDVPLPIPSVDELPEVEPTNSAWRGFAPRNYRSTNWSY